MFLKLMQKMQSWLLPFTCILCGVTTKTYQDLCFACKQDLPWIKHTCQQCGCALEQTMKKCGQCLQNPPHFDRTIPLFHYQPPLNKLIVNLKFHKQLLYARLLGEFFTENLAIFYKIQSLPEVIIPIPLYRKRLQERGFNQALELAKPISKKLQIPIDLKSVQRIRHTEAQSLIPAEQRHRNVKNAFKVTENFQFTHVALLDDVMTTGHTVNELSRVLRNGGVEKIDIWCCARAGN